MDPIKAELALIEAIAVRNGPNFLSMQDLQSVYNSSKKIVELIGRPPMDVEIIRILVCATRLMDKAADNIRALRMLDEMFVEFDRILDAPGDVVAPMKALARKLDHDVLLEHPTFAELHSMVQTVIDLA